MDANFSLWPSLALAAIQGATEFLPVSSSGHLVLARKIFGWSDQGGLLFDTVLHGGSLAAILIYFWREWVAILRAYASKQAILDIGYWKLENPNSPPQADSSVANKIENRQPQAGPPEAEKSKIESANGAYRRLPWLAAIATVPVVMAGPVLKPLLESGEQIRNASITGLSMIMTALLFLLAERFLPPKKEKQVNFLHAIFIGCLQVVALLPGASRSGWTTAGGIFCGQKRDRAVRFAFFMAVPAIAGAIIFQSREIIRSPGTGFDPFFILSGFGVSLLVSLGAIHFCLKYFQAHSLRPFAVYLMIIGLMALLIK